MPLDATPPDADAPQPRRPDAPRDEDRAWYDLARELRVFALDAPGPAGIDYERAQMRVQCSPSSPEDAMISQMLRGAGHVRVDPVEARLAAMAPGRTLSTLRWLRGYAPALEWLAADKVQRRRGELLDALADDSGIATVEDMQRWHVSGRLVDARRQWARLRLREAWAAWFGRAW